MTRLVLEEIEGIGYGEVENVGDGLSFISDLQRLAVVAPSLTDLAGDVDVRKEVHLDFHQPVALTGLATAALHVE